MKKLTLAEKLARKAFEGAECQKSWSVHMAAFGPILEPAFAENYQARVHLTAALNLISSRQTAKGLEKLKQVQKYCESDADKAAFLFFLGVCFEMSGDRQHMLEFYCAANEYGHKFPMPYLKAGKAFLENHAYEPAFEQYRSAIRCYTATGLSEQDKIVLGSAWTNLATCLTMMHRYEEAGRAVATSRSLCSDAPGRAAVEAVLYALERDISQLEVCLTTVKNHAPDAYDAIKASTDGILAGTDPMFFAVQVDAENIAVFWDWFTHYSPKLLSLLQQEQYEQAMAPVGDSLLTAFPFLEEPPYIALGKNENGYVLELHDCYAVGIQNAYEKLLQACPESVKAQWQFVLVR